jgi:hypothetical protein
MEADSESAIETITDATETEPPNDASADPHADVHAYTTLVGRSRHGDDCTDSDTTSPIADNRASTCAQDRLDYHAASLICTPREGAQ